VSAIPAHGSDDLAAALAAELAGQRSIQLQAAVLELQSVYRSGGFPATELPGTSTAAAAYAGYRMPATHAAISAAMSQVVRAQPSLRPRSMVDVGGGTGAALWAAAAAFPSLEEAEVIDRSRQALQLGRALARRSQIPLLRRAHWKRQALDWGLKLPQAELLTISYVLGELPADTQARLVTAAADTEAVILIIEPGTPGGYERVMTARSQLIDQGYRVLAPCPHSTECPLRGGEAWCHFAVRLARSRLHRQLKGATLGFEDEKFSFVAAIRPPATPGVARVISKPRRRTGAIDFELCTPTCGTQRLQVTKRERHTHRAAANLRWGDTWTDRS
jgi:ribosomal protein RSM22 (predicted rRNA methylase)